MFHFPIAMHYNNQQPANHMIRNYVVRCSLNRVQVSKFVSVITIYKLSVGTQFCALVIPLSFLHLKETES